MTKTKWTPSVPSLRNCDSQRVLVQPGQSLSMWLWHGGHRPATALFLDDSTLEILANQRSGPEPRIVHWRNDRDHAQWISASVWETPNESPQAWIQWKQWESLSSHGAWVGVFAPELGASRAAWLQWELEE